MGRDIKSRAYVRIGLPMKPHTCIDTPLTAPLPNRAFGNAKAEHLVARIGRRLARFHGDPGVHGEDPAPRDCTGGIDLYHHLRRGRRIGT